MKNLLVIILLMLILVAMRIPFIDEPFERDEGGYAYMGQCILEGKIMYKDMWETMPPGLPYMYAAIFKLYGVSFYAIRIFSIFWAIIGLLFLYFLTDCLYGKKIAVITGFVYAIFSGGPIVQGASGNTEPFMIVFLIIGLYFFVLSEKRNSKIYLVIAGMATGLAITIKQPAIMSLAAFVFYVVYREYTSQTKNRFKNTLKISSLLLAGAAIPWIPFFVCFTKYNLWNDFVYAVFIWNFKANQSFLTEGIFYRLLRSFLYVSRENLLLWLLSGTSVIYILINKRLRENMLILFWSFFSFLGVCLGGMFYPHYYIQVLPALAILSGYSLNIISEQMKEKGFWKQITNIFTVTIIILLLVSTGIFEYKYFFIYTPDEVSAEKYGSSIFVFARDLAEYIENETETSDTIFVWGIEPEIYFYAKRKCPTRFIHNYSLKGNDNFASSGRKEVIEDIKTKKPVFIIPGMSLDDFPELKEYVDENYIEQEYKGLILYRCQK